MAYGGLRGGIAFALTKLTSIQLVPQINVMLCACLVVIFFTSFIQGHFSSSLVLLILVQARPLARS